MPSRLGWIAIAAVIVAGVVAWTVRHRAQPVHYVTAPVTRGDIARAVTASGTVNPVNTVEVGSYVSGVITSVSCDYNTHVTKGQVCARIDPRPYQTTIDQDQANLDAARAQLKKDQTAAQLAQTEYQRNQDLWSRSLVPKDTLDQTRAAAAQAATQVQLDQTAISQRRAALESAQVNLGYTKIVSPVDGIVVSRNITTGQTVAASFQTPTLFLIAADLTKMQVDTNVSESDIGGVQPGERASFTVEAFPNHAFDGTVSQVRQAPQTVQNVVTYDVVVATSNPQQQLKPGMTATVRLITAERKDVVRVPDQALRFVPGGAAGDRQNETMKPIGTAGREGGAQTRSVWVLRDNHPVRIAITAGLDDGTNAEMAKGELKPGDQVIVSAQGTNNSAKASGRSPRLRF